MPHSLEVTPPLNQQEFHRLRFLLQAALIRAWVKQFPQQSESQWVVTYAETFDRMYKDPQEHSFFLTTFNHGKPTEEGLRYLQERLDQVAAKTRNNYK